MAEDGSAVEPDLLRLLWEAAHAVDDMSRHMERHIGISGTERLVIRELVRRPGVTSTALAQAIRIRPATLVGVVGRLAERGLIDRPRSPGDGEDRLTATSAGQRLLRSRGATVESVLTATTATMPAEERRSAGEFLEGVARALRAAADDTKD